MLTLLIVILHDTACLPNLLAAWKKIGVPGVTLMESVGGFQAENLLKRSGLSALLTLFNQSTEKQRFIVTLINNQDTLDQAVSEADRVVGGFDRPNSGILFTLPIGQVLGLKKRQTKDVGQSDLPISNKNSDNLLSWYEEEIREQYGEKVFQEWENKRKQTLSKIIDATKNKANITTVDSSIADVLIAIKNNPEIPFVCVTNIEERLVGIIHILQLLKLELIPKMPQSFIQDPEGFEKAIEYARKHTNYVASDIMTSPQYVLNDGTLEEAFIIISKSNLTYLPIVNKHYRIKGILSSIDLLSIE